MLISVLILSIIEGITEFLPVSSTGHLLLVSPYLNLSADFYTTFDIAIQLGAILAVPTLYPHYFIRGLRQPLGMNNRRLMMAILPLLIVGFLAKDFIRSLFLNPTVILLGLIVGGVIMIIMDRVVLDTNASSKSVTSISIKQSLIVGIWQCASLWPGMSRSAMTILGGMASGMTRSVSASFSFLMAVPLLIIIVGYDAISTPAHLTQNEWGWIGLGMLITYGLSVGIMKWFIHMIQRRGLTFFGIYRIVFGIIGLLLLV